MFYPGIWIIFGITLIAVVTCSATNQDCIDKTPDCLSPEARVAICSHEKTRVFCMKSCNLCPVDGVWNNWSSWSVCSETCGVGNMNRTRTCHFESGKPHGRVCQGPANETKLCLLQRCPVDGILEDWSDWSPCSVTCGGGQTRRVRICLFPEPSNRGNDCHGTRKETESCATHSCPVDGVWIHWSRWSSCTVTCGGGQKRRDRTCNYPDPTNRGKDCQGVKHEVHPCSTQKCPVDAVWNRWSSWSSCTLTCGGGQSRRTRTCHYPDPTNRGRDCRGTKMETHKCSTQKCPVDGAWNHWSSWSSCTLTCGGGQSRRTRTCHYPDPTNRGRDCRGTMMETHKCSTQKCPVDGTWSDWSKWSYCSASCGGGNKRRHRTCRFPPNSVKGKQCLGVNTEVDRCSMMSCPEAECQSRGGQCQGIEDYCHGYHREGICTTGSHCCIQMDDSEFVGCFGHLQIWGIDIGSSFSHNVDTRWFFYPGNMTIQYCIQHCKSFNMNYAALENESKCECSDTIPHKCHKITNEDCTLRCGGDRATVCGDRGKVSLYRIL